MIGIDTNVLLRFVLEDDPRLSRSATDFLGEDGRPRLPAMISPVVLVEFVWTLMRREGFSKARVLDILDAFTDSERVAFSAEGLMRSCIEQWRDGAADLPDYLIAALNLQAGASTTVTFDETAGREVGFTLLSS